MVEHTFVRRWNGAPIDLLERLRLSLETAGFRLTTPSYWALHGERGSAVAMSKRSLPLAVDAAVVQAPDGAVTGHVRLTDRMPVPLAANAVERGFRDRFAEIEREVDVALGYIEPVTPAAVVPTGEPSGATMQPASAPASEATASRRGLDKAGAALERLTSKTQEKASAAIGRGSGEPWQKVQSVTFWCPPDQAIADAERIQVYAAVAAMVRSQPDSLPENLTGELTAFVEGLRTVLNSAAEADMRAVRYDLEAPQRPIVDFLEQQAAMREQLPVRTLHRCRDCGQQKVSNPDYKRLKERNRKMQALTGAVGLTLRGGSASPFVLVGALFRLKKLDPDYVCGRCQGMDCEESIATFCPNCGSLRPEAVLRRCSECDHDLRSDIAPGEVWHSVGSL